MLLDKESLNKALTDSCNELKLKLDQMKQEHDENVALRERIADLIQERDKALKQVEYGERSRLRVINIRRSILNYLRR